MFKIANIIMSAMVVVLTGYSGFSYAAALPSSVMAANAAVPPSIIGGADPNVMINLSIETPMQGAAYNDQNDTSGCGGRVGGDGVCYFPNNEYLGYFNPNLCYDYDATNEYFAPAANANSSDHSCSSKWSGNFLNWVSMMAIDEFRWALTGGHRSTDTATVTVLERGNMGLGQPHSWYPFKRIGNGVNVATNTVTPYSETDIFINNYGTRFRLSNDGSSNANKRNGNVADDIRVRVLTCDGTWETESSTYRNCAKYGNNLKPEGLIQKNSGKMRFAVMSFLRDNAHNRHGGVLRANMKYVGGFMPAPGGGTMTNPNVEIDNVTGVFIVNPDTADATASGVANSGVINYINKFGANGYKAFDPIGELFYECLNYYKNRGPTPEFSADLVTGNPLPPGDPRLDGFPAITNWNDPIQHACQQNYIVGINDANPWEDKRLPGTSALVQSDADYTFNIANSDDWGDPGNSDPDINVTTETNLVGEMQGINGTIRNIGCVPGDCDWNSGNTKTIDNLGKVFGTAPYAPKENSYYIAGLAYYAASNDIRSGAGDYEGMQTVQTFLIDTQEFNNNPLTGEMNMLWLAGKYGGFNEKNFQTTTENPGNSYQPDQTDEWDEDGDGVPDNYVLANDPAKLVAGLTKAFSNIEGRISAGNAPAVVSDGFNGIGAFYQAIYSPKVRNNAGDEAQWVGQLHALFIDGSGRFREDGNKNGQLDDVSTDNIVELRYNPAATPGPARTQVYRYNTESDYTAGTPSSPLAEIDDLNAIWKAADQLAKLDQSKIHQQRGYTTKIVDNSGAGRYILTWKDKNADGVVGPGEEVAFIASEMDENIMAVVDDAEADRVVAFIRGKEDGTLGYRSRSLGARRFLLGDVVNSAPVSVSLPNKSYDLLKGDTTYGAFRTQYRNRRHVVYVGANDGMLHAFNGGFYDASTKAFKLIRPKESFESTTPKDQPLGSELWAYIPGNLLPHLQWLKELTYPHLYYVDGSPQAFDVNIFPEDSEHPNGWGTILVVNMRFGGGSVTYDHDGKGSTPAITARSAIVVLDITNPETPPNLIAEISDAKLGFTTSKPTLVIQREPGDNNDWSTPNTNNWYLAFGSGPIGSNALTQATSDQSARLYLYDLKLRQLVQFGGDNYLDLAISNAFVGDPASKNWGTDFMDDAIYYGTVAGSVGTPTGGLYRVPLNGSPLGTPSLLLSPLPNQPFTTAPTFTLDFITKDRWVYAGTGRLFVNSDNQSATQQSFYGVKDPGSGNSWGSVSVSDMQNTTGLQVFSSGDMKDPNGVIPGGAVVGGDIINAVNNSDFNRFRKYMLGKKGWFVNFNVGAKNSTRTIFASVTHQAFVLFPEYAPPLDVCTPEGNSRLNALFYRTGTAFAGIGLGDDTSTYNSNGDFLTASFTQYSYGVLSTPGTFITQERRTKLILCDSTASCGGGLFDERLPASGGRRSWREIR